LLTTTGGKRIHTRIQITWKFRGREPHAGPRQKSKKIIHSGGRGPEEKGYGGALALLYCTGSNCQKKEEVMEKPPWNQWMCGQNSATKRREEIKRAQKEREGKEPGG